MIRKSKRILPYVVVLVVSIGLIIVNVMKSSFAWIVTNGGVIQTAGLYGATVFDMSKYDNYTVPGFPFTNSSGDEVALTIVRPIYNINESNIEKSGDSTSFELDGNNSAVKVLSSGTLNYQHGNINTNGTYSPGLYEDGGKITIVGTNITTHSSHSSGLVSANGGETILNSASIETFGSSSPAIHVISPLSKVTVFGGVFKTHENDSPVINTNGNLTINNGNMTTNLISEQSDGILIVDGGAVSLNRSNLTVSQAGARGIVLHHAKDDSVISFSANNSNFSVNNGDVFYVNGAKAVIELANNTVNANGGNFMGIGDDGSDVTLNLSNQDISGDINVGSNSKLSMNLSDGSVFEGSIQTNDASGLISLNLSADSRLILTDDINLGVLNNALSDNSNISLNGHDLYINGEKLNSGSSHNQGNDNTGNDNTSDNQGSGNTLNEDTSNNGSSDSQGNNDTGNESTSNNGTSNDNNLDNNIDIGTNNSNGGSNNQSGSGTGTKNDTGNGSSGNGTGSGKSSSSKSKNNNNGTNKSSNDNKKSKDGVVSGSNSNGSGSKSSSGNKNVDSNSKLDGSIDKNINAITDGKKDNKSVSRGISESIYMIDDRNLVIINVIGIIMIITSVVFIVKDRVLRKVNKENFSE